MMDLRKYTVKEFANAINENVTVITNLMRNNSHLGYTNKPYENAVLAVQNSEVKDSNKEIVAKFLYTNICNRAEHRFYNGRGYGIELRGWEYVYIVRY